MASMSGPHDPISADDPYDPKSLKDKLTMSPSERLKYFGPLHDPHEPNPRIPCLQ